MKVRSNFVSNSSSSSYVIIGRKWMPNFDICDPESKDVYCVGKYGEKEFGWGPKKIEDVHSRINFAFLQAFCYSDNKEWQDMCIDSVKKTTGATGVVVWISDNYHSPCYGYIDHQSSAEEGRNIEIFESIEILTRFLFSKDSAIILDNDNRF